MTKEQLLERNKDLQGGLEEVEKKIKFHESELKKLIGNRSANIVAIRENERWIAEVTKAEEAEKKEKKSKEK